MLSPLDERPTKTPFGGMDAPSRIGNMGLAGGSARADKVGAATGRKRESSRAFCLTDFQPHTNRVWFASLPIVCPACNLDCFATLRSSKLQLGNQRKYRRSTVGFYFLPLFLMDEFDRAIQELRVAQVYTPSEEDLQNLEYLESMGV